MKRIYVSIPELTTRHIIYKRIHIVNLAAKQSNLYLIVQYLPL